MGDVATASVGGVTGGMGGREAESSLFNSSA